MKTTQKFILVALATLCATCAVILFMKGNTVKATEETPYDKYAEHPFLPLYEPGKVPYNEGVNLGERLFIIPYLAKNPTGVAMVVFPGGAYKFTDNGLDNTGSHQEAGDIAEQFYNEAGISVFVVDYRTKTTAPNCDYHGILSDGQRAVRYVRYHAKDFGIDPEKIGVMGFSAGGHLAAMLLTNYDYDVKDPSVPEDEIDKVSAKPACAVLSYAVMSFKDTFSHGGTRTNFTNNDASVFDDFSMEDHLSAETGPVFFWCNIMDPSVPPAADLMMARKFEELNIPYELHLYNLNDKKHDPGTGQDYANAATWPKLSLKFLESIGMK